MRQSMFMRFLVLSAIFLSLPYIAQAETKANSEQEYMSYAYEIINEFSEQMRDEFHLDCVGSGGVMPHGIEEISVKLACRESHSIQSARDLEVKAVERFLQIINSHQKIRPFLKRFPFIAQDVSVGISFYNKNKGEKDPDYLVLVKNVIYYAKKNPKTKQLVDLFEEPYEEAVKIVQEAK